MGKMEKFKILLLALIFISLIYVPIAHAHDCSVPEDCAEVIRGAGILEAILAFIIGLTAAVAGLRHNVGASKTGNISRSRIFRQPDLTYWPDQVLLNQKFIGEFPMDPPKVQDEAEDLGEREILKQPLEVEAVLRAPGFDIEGAHSQVIQVSEGEVSKARFMLIPRRLGQQMIRLDFYQYGRRIGTVRRNVLVVEKEPIDMDVPQPEVLPLAGLMTTAPKVPPPDLELVVELDRYDQRTLYFTLHSIKEIVGYHHAKLGQVVLRVSPEKIMASLSREMGRMAGRSPTTSEAKTYAEGRLARLGNDLWELLIPEQLKLEYWRFKTHVKSMLITSDEPWIPWEMIKPYRYDDNEDREEDPFWCQKFSVARWLSGPATTDELRIGAVRPVASTHAKLPSVEKEIKFIGQLNNLRRGFKVLAPFTRRLQLLNWLEKEDFSILHIACHGRFDATFPSNSAILLSDGPIRPSDIQTRFGGRRKRPLVFINACHGGRMGFNLTGLGGWANQLVQQSHVGIFVGTMWEVDDALALHFARHFYESLLRKGQSLAEAFRSAREDIRRLAPYNPTWLAYVLYADPEGVIADLENKENSQN